MSRSSLLEAASRHSTHESRSVHRGETYVESRLSSRLFGGLGTRIGISEPHGEAEIVDILADLVHEEFPAWFGEELEEIDDYVSGDHLTEAQLREAYFGDDLEPETGLCIREDGVFSEIVQPFTEELLECIAEQREADREAAVRQGRWAIKQTVVEEVAGGALDIDDAQEAVAEALARLEEGAVQSG